MPRATGAIPINPGFGKDSFSQTEVVHIVIAVLVLSAAFANVFKWSLGGFFNPDPLLDYLGMFGLSMVLILTSFLGHELSHKFVAQRYGAWAEFRMFPMGLVFAFLLSFTGFLFAAPGAVYIEGRITERQYGLISAAGPASNIVMAVVGVALLFITSGAVAGLVALFITLNLVLALFNLIPIGPLDGAKILRWNTGVYLFMVAVAGGMYALLFLL
ncbi:MAG: site-2 protease family protein [Thermoplasmatales archaeon]|nr:site-2 protease family protein [Thermoplasmatales archaeon]